METIGAIVACGAALVFGFVLGVRWTLGQPWGVLAGIVMGEAFAFLYFACSIWVGRNLPGVLEARRVGIHFMVLVVAAAVCGGVASWIGHRKSMGRSLF